MDLVDMIRRRIREEVYNKLEKNNATRPPYPIRGRIPNFKGAEQAAELLARTPEWRNSKIIKVNPDSPQRPVRLKALKEGKTLIMPTPRIRQGFLLLPGGDIPEEYKRYASTIRGAFRFGILLDTIPKIKTTIKGIDLIVEGSVAIDKNCNRLGKGEGYGDIEYGILTELGIVDEKTPIATTIHDLQLVDNIPRKPHDVPVDLIVTNTRIIRCGKRGHRPKGIDYESLPKEKLDAIPLLKELLERRGIG